MHNYSAIKIQVLPNVGLATGEFFAQKSPEIRG